MRILILISFYFLVSCGNDKGEKNSISRSLDIQTPSSDRPVGAVYNLDIGCGFNKRAVADELLLKLPSDRAKQEIQNILSFSGLPVNFEIYSANISNAVATTIKGKRYILYDPLLLDGIDKDSNSYWGSISILAHEIGHHLSGHTMDHVVSVHNSELEADKFSGFILYKMGATLDQSLHTIQLIGAENDSESHPSKQKRIAAIREGWLEASKQRYKGALPPPPNDDIDSFCEYNTAMLISKEYREYEGAEYWYGEQSYLYGIITEVDKNLESFTIHITKTDKQFEVGFRSLDNEEWTVWLDQKTWGSENEMSHVCSMNLPYLIVPGRRLKFSMVEGCPGCGTAMNGVWTLTYAKAVK